jgi:hypothetical protein
MNKLSEKWASFDDALQLEAWCRHLNDSQKPSVWDLLSSSQKVYLWNLLDDRQKMYFWNLLNAPRKIHIWNLLENFQEIKIHLWNLLENPQKIYFWDLLNSSQKISLWDLLEEYQKIIFFDVLDDPQKKNFWNILRNTQRKETWNSLKDYQKATLLEVLSRNYTLAQIVYAAREIVEERLKNDKCFKEYHFTNVYIYLEDSALGNIPGTKKAVITAWIDDHRKGKGKSLHLRIIYDTEGGIVGYDNEKLISTECARFLVGHEIGHILLYLNDIIEKVLKKEQISESLEVEKDANVFAQMLSDLRDLYLLRDYGSLTSDETLLSDDDVINLHCAKIKNCGIAPEKIVQMIHSLNNKSKTFTMSSFVFATKKIMSTIYSEDNHKISEIYSRIVSCRGDDIVQIEPFRPLESEDAINFGYSIGVPKSDHEETISRDTAKGIGALLLDYEVIKNAPENVRLIPVDEKKFSMDRIKDFYECLLKERKKYLNKFCQEMVSKERLIKNI